MVTNQINKLLLIKDDERSATFYFMLLFLVLGFGTAIGRGTTDALFFKRYGIEYLPVMYIVLSVLLFIMSTVYAAYADRLPPERFFRILNGIIIVMLAIAGGL